MTDEFTSLTQHIIWDLVAPPQNCNVTGCKRVSAIKRHPDGIVERSDLDYRETFSSVVKYVEIRTVLTLALL